MVRLARRPWFYTRDLYKLVAVQRLRSLGTRDVSKLVGLAHLTLDTQRHSIFWNNLRLVMRGLQNIAVQRVRIKSSALALPTFEKKVLIGLRRWLNQWQKAGVLIVLRASLVVSKAQTLRTVFDDSNKWGKTPHDLIS